MDNVQQIPLDKIVPSLGNDRTIFDPAALQELAESIRRDGLAQPITVRQLTDGTYQLVAGERRFRAHKLLQAGTVRALVVELSDEQAISLMLAENSARRDLDPIDEARAYKRRMTEYAWDEKTVAARAGVSVQIVRNRLALLGLREDMQHLVRSGNLLIGYAQILAESGLDNNRQLIALKRLNECPAPTPQWLRKTCAELCEQQDSADMFDGGLFAAADFAGTVRKQDFTQKLPADPRKDKAPMLGATFQEMISNQVAFWMTAADKWDRFGKSAQRDRCLAAMSSLQAIAAIMPAHGRSARKLKSGSQTFAVYQLAN